MAELKVELPKMGESVAEATITTWLKSVGDKIEEDEPIVEIATDKVDSEVPSPCSGILKEALFSEGDVVQVGSIFAVIETDQNVGIEIEDDKVELSEMEVESEILKPLEKEVSEQIIVENTSDRFYSPLVKSIAKKENINQDEL
ncbi:MAG: biotin/lipoyl-containing protein, partial [Bacteroidota bacterium]|nr:biotin/lipoyl-containing protein [Bacteroidota bacterium]